MTTQKTNALLLVVSAPSGAGKSTLCNRLVEKFPSMTYSVSCTTRPPRGEEKNHQHYHFLSREEFCAKVERGEFLEHAEVHGNFYGTLQETVRQALKEGRDLVMDIDVQGASQIRAVCAALPADDPLRKSFVDIFIAPPSMDELRSRLCGRATDGEEVIEKRMRNAEEEMKERGAYQHLIINDNLDDAMRNLAKVICLERENRG